MTTLLMSLIAAALLVIAALYWRQVQVDEQGDGQQEDGRVTPLLKGINYLLSDEPDLALQEMVQVARLKSEAADVYMALGEMFRAKGEIGRAVRIHQNILARPDVSRELHLQAHLALGKDFQTGGLLDRALRQYEKALMMRSDHIAALEASLRIREQSREWIEAEELLSRLEQIQGDKLHLHRAYLFAEMAANDLAAKEIGRAEKSARRALELHDGCAHAYIVLARICLVRGDFEEVERVLGWMKQHAFEHLHLLIPAILENRKFYNSHGHRILLGYWKESSDDELALSWLEAVAERGGGEMESLKQELGFSPASLRASLRLAGIEQDSEQPLTRHAAQWRRKMKHFICSRCGVKVVELRWQCPQCHEWGSMHAIREEDI